MGKKTVFTNITPLPSNVSREVAVAMLHNHDEMIELNPLVIDHHPIKTPRDAPKDEFLDCAWHEMTDRISYLPGGMVKGKVTYKGCFHDLPNGLQTHIYAPMNLDIREKWTVCGALPGEPEEARELGLNTPRRGLYLREDAEMKCNVLMTSFVRKNLDNSHKVLVERIMAKAERIQAQVNYGSAAPSETSSLRDGPNNILPFQAGSHMANSHLVRQMSSTPPSASPTNPFARSEPPRVSSDSSTFRTARPQISSHGHHTMIQELPASQPDNLDGAIQPQTLAEGDPEEIRAVHPALRERYRQNLTHNATRNDGASARPPTAGKSFAIELEGSRPATSSSKVASSSGCGIGRGQEPVELDGGYVASHNDGISPMTATISQNGYSGRDGSISELSIPVNDRGMMPNPLTLAHMRSYSQPLIEADTFINSASGAHNMDPNTGNISAHPAVGGVGGVVFPQSRFRALSNSAGTMLSPNANTNANTNTNMSANTNKNLPPNPSNPIPNTNKSLPLNPSNPASHTNYNYTQYNNNNSQNQNPGPTPSNEADRFSMVSEISDMPTPKSGQFAFGTGQIDNRFSVVSAITDGAPTPRIPASSSFADQQRQYMAQSQTQMARERERDWETQRRNFI